VGIHFLGVDVSDDSGPIEGVAISVVAGGQTVTGETDATGFAVLEVRTDDAAAVTVSATGSTYWSWAYGGEARQSGSSLTGIELDIHQSDTLTVIGSDTPPTSPPPPPPPPSATTYSITGTIDQTPLTASRRVFASKAGETAGYFDDTDTGETPSYAITGLAAGTYTVVLSLGDNESSSPSSITVTVGPNATGKNFDVSFTPSPPPATYSIAGAITQPSGSPARRLYATPTGGSEGYFDLTASGKNPTYSIPNVAAGTYVVTPELFAGETASPTSISVTVGPNATGKDFTISSNPTASLKARLVEEDGSPITGVAVTFTDNTAVSEIDTLTTDVDGYAGTVSVPVGHTVEAEFTAAGTWTWADALGDNSGTGSKASIVMPGDSLVIVFTRATPP
jgi:hypothetical protein